MKSRSVPGRLFSASFLQSGCHGTQHVERECWYNVRLKITRLTMRCPDNLARKGTRQDYNLHT